MLTTIPMGNFDANGCLHLSVAISDKKPILSKMSVSFSQHPGGKMSVT
jgi:hypothetical protein